MQLSLIFVFGILCLYCGGTMKKICFIVFFVFYIFFISVNNVYAYDLNKREEIFTPAFQLLWDDFKNLISVKKINFVGLDPKVAKVLNSCPFSSSDISDDSYYKIVAPKSFELKAKIQREIFEKFGETSKLLDDIDWAQNGLNEYILYALLKKNIEFPVEFDVLNSQPFNGSKDNYNRLTAQKTIISILAQDMVRKDSQTKLNHCFMNTAGIMQYPWKQNRAIVLYCTEQVLLRMCMICIRKLIKRQQGNLNLVKVIS